MNETNHKFIKNLKESEQINTSYLVTNVTRGVTNNNAAYLSVTMQDSSGTIEAKKWDANEKDIEIFKIGNIVLIKADVINYRTGLQLKILSGEALDINRIDISLYTISAPIPLDELKIKLQKYVDSIQDEELNMLVKEIITPIYDLYTIYPAAVRNHHEYTSGLLYHTLSMASIASAISGCYPEVNYDLLMCGVLLHDVGKTIELTRPPIVKYSKEGRLIGHISIMHSVIRETAFKLEIDEEKRVLLEHMILSHHGQYDYGSPVLPLTREALLLHMIDDMDAKMTIINKAFANIEEGEFTPKLFPLDERCFYKPKLKK